MGENKWTKGIIRRGLTKDLWIVGNGKECYYAVTVGTPRVLRGDIVSGNCLFKTKSIKEALDYMEGEKI